MTFDTKWNVDYYKTEYESDEHWELRRSFMVKHKDKFAEDELVCLAQVFTNVEFLGCRYPEETMRRVGLLSQDVAAEFRKSRATKLKRTFVGAQDAAGAKAKGIKSVESKPYTQHTQSTATTHTDGNRKYLGLGAGVGFAQHGESSSSNQLVIVPAPNPVMRSNLNLRPNQYKNLVLIQTNPEQDTFCILQSSIMKNNSIFTCRTEQLNGKCECIAAIDECELAKATGNTAKEAKAAACEIALKLLQKSCYTIIKKSDSSQQINIDGSKRDTATTTATTLAKSVGDNYEENKLTTENKGFKMMKLMGWTGGALGSDKRGREEPVSVVLRVGRKGLGIADNAVPDVQINKRYFNNYLCKYAKDNGNIHELIFSTEYTKEERVELHKIAKRLGLKSASKNSPDGERYLTITKKVSPFAMATNILNGDIYAQQYYLVFPTNK